MRQLDEMTQHNAALVEQTNAAVEQTEGQALELDAIVGTFHIGSEREEGSPTSGQRIAPRARYVSEGSAAISADWDEF